MRDSYLFSVLETFSAAEMDAFREFLESPYFNKGARAQKHIALFQVFFEALQTSNPGILEKNRVYKRLFPEGPAVEGKLDKLASEFKKLLHTFLLTRHYLHADKAKDQALDLAMLLRKRSLLDKSRQMLDRAYQHTGNAGRESQADLLFRFQLAKEEYDWLFAFGKLKSDMNLLEVLRTLDQYYTTVRLDFLNRLLLQQTFTVLPPEAAGYIGEPWAFSPDHKDAKALIRIYGKLHAILQAPSSTVADFEQLRDLLRESEPGIDPVHIHEFFTYLRNVCTHLMQSRGLPELRPVLFQLQQDNLGRGYFYYGGKIHVNAILTITQTALSLGAISWASTFVEAHRDRLMGDNETQDTYRICKAICLFAEKQYEAALQCVPHGTAFMVLHLLARRTELKIYYELRSDLLPYKIDAFKFFLRRTGTKALSKEIKDMQKNFLNFLCQLSLPLKTRGSTRSEKLIRRIHAQKILAERAWLLEKARELGAGGQMPK